jgi:hypothetical protein
VAAALLVATAQAADQRPSLIGATRSQVLQRYGDPTSQMVAGSREIMFFARERVVLRNGIVVEVEVLAAEPVRRAPPVATPSAPSAPSVDASTAAAPSQIAVAQPASPAPIATAAVATPVATPTTPGPAVPSDVTTGTQPAPAAPPPPPPPEPQLAIKFVRPPSAGYTPAASRQEVVPPSISPDAVAVQPAPAAAALAQTPSAPSAQPVAAPTATTPPPIRSAPPGGPVSLSAPTITDSAPEAVAEAETPAKPDEPGVSPPEEKKAKVKAKSPRRRVRAADGPEPVESVFTTQTYVIAFLAIGAAGYLLWLRRQRQLDLAATAVSRTPFSAPASTGSGAMFEGELIRKLEWKRFEELVASYYSKTGVVAVRTKTGPSSPVHVKISWKGEPRPFACVQCIAHPPSLIEAKCIQDLYAVLAAEDIRRGYVVTTGKFSIPARDFAEEKHLTLLSGDLFLEKLNALPDSARTELMEEITTGDYTTPSCPQCDAKAVRSDDDPSAWRCKSHPDIVIPAGK